MFSFPTDLNDSYSIQYSMMQTRYETFKMKQPVQYNAIKKHSCVPN